MDETYELQIGRVRIRQRAVAVLSVPVQERLAVLEGFGEPPGVEAALQGDHVRDQRCVRIARGVCKIPDPTRRFVGVVDAAAHVVVDPDPPENPDPFGRRLCCGAQACRSGVRGFDLRRGPALRVHVRRSEQRLQA